MAQNTKHESKWLQEAIHSAKESLESWPDWMRKSARFEGDDHHRQLSEQLEETRSQSKLVKAG